MSNDANNQGHIQWTRCWCPRDANVYIDDGFLVKAGIGKKDYFNPDAKPLSDYLDAPCLILLGPPGMGKTTEIEAAHEGDTGPKLLVNMGDVTSEINLRAKLSGSPTLKQWQQDKPDVPTLWLDSLDEALADVSNIVKILKAELRALKQAVPGLRLRIACRVADWLPSLEGAFRELWGGENCRTIGLLPLRREDVDAAAQAHGLNAQAFMEAVFAAKAGPLAAKPVTLLRFLLPEFQKHLTLPRSQVALYESGCRSLASEWVEHRREHKSANADAERRFQTAQSVAAAMIFYGRDRLDCACGDRDVADGAVHSREIGILSSGSEGIPGAPTIQDVEEVAHTALMSGDVAPHLYRFGHRTYQEFMAALFLHRQMSLPTSHMPLPKVLALFLNPASNDKRIVPQLLETAAWLAALNEKFRADLLDADPVAVLHSDVARQDGTTKRKLFEALCDGLRRRELYTGEWHWGAVRGLKFDGIADELRKILDDTTLHEELHRFAIDVADENEITEVYDKLADLALDTTRSEVVRRLSARAVAHAPDTPETYTKAKARLEPLLSTTPADDPDDNLRGNALYALWRGLEPKKLFALLTPPHNDSHSGAYWVFTHTLMRGLEVQHLEAGLAWAVMQPRFHDMSFDFRRLMQRVFNLAWLNLDTPGVLDALAGALAARTAHHESVQLDRDGEEDYDPYNRRPTDEPSELATDNPEVLRKRRKLCQAVVATMARRPQRAGQTAAFAIAYHLELVQPADFDWLLERYVAAEDQAQRALWLELASSHWAAWRGTPDQVALVRKLETRSEDIRIAFREPIALLDPNSRESVAQREAWERHERKFQAIIDKRNADSKLLDPPPARRVVELLDAFENGNSDAFPKALQWMKMNEYGRGHFGLLDFDVRNTIGWEEATPETRRRLITAAAKYLESAQDSPDEWVGTNKLHPPSTAGLSALILLYHEQRDVFDRLPGDAWARWPHILLEHGHSGKHETGEALVKSGYPMAPAAFQKSVGRLLRAEAQHEQWAAVLSRIDPVWDNAISEVVFKVVREGNCSPAVLEQALTLLVEHNHQPARDWCVASLAEAEAQEPAIVALLSNGPTRDEWAELWPLLIKDEERAKRILGRDRHSARGRAILEGLMETQLADLYLWLRPRSLQERPRGFHTVGVLEQLLELRNAALSALAERGTEAAVAQLERIGGQINDPWFHTLIIQARANMRRAGYLPIKPHDLWRNVAEAKSRLVRGEGELCDVVMEAFGRINDRLQQRENPRMKEIWEGSSPMDEKDLSTWLADQLYRELTQSGIIIGREIEIGLPGVQGDQGQTDLQVVARPASDEREFGVIIEVKGCWNDKVNTAMETQLRDRYLKNHSYTHGIYVVFWFYSDAWQGNNSKRSHTRDFRGMTRDQAQAKFAKQAEDLGTGGITMRAFVFDARRPDAQAQPRE